MGRLPVHLGRSNVATGHPEGAPSDVWTDRRVVDCGADGSVAELRAQGLSIRAISQRTGLPRSTVADRLVRVGDGMPARIVGRDGRRYLAVRDPRLHGLAASSPRGDAIGMDAPSLADPSRELRRLLLLGSLRQARDLVSDVVPLAEHDRLRIALDIAAITRMAGVRQEDVARARDGRRPAPRDDRS